MSVSSFRFSRLRSLFETRTPFRFSTFRTRGVKMSSKAQSWKATPSIVVEDVDRRQSKIDHIKYPDKNANTQIQTKEKPSISLETCNPLSPLNPSALGAMIEPDVDAYVTPLSLCHPPTLVEQSPDPSPKSPLNAVTPVSVTAAPPPVMVADYESSFTSVDIGTSNIEEASWWSHSAVSRQSTSTGCFDIGSGLFSVGGLAQAIPGGNLIKPPRCQHQIALDFSEVPHIPSGKTNSSLKKRMKQCSVIGVVFLAIAIIAVIAAGVALYVQFIVAKPSSNAARTAINETNICDFIVDACVTPQNTTEIQSLHLNATSTLEKRSPYGKDGERAKATFSSSFVTQLNKMVQAKSS